MSSPTDQHPLKDREKELQPSSLKLWRMRESLARLVHLPRVEADGEIHSWVGYAISSITPEKLQASIKNEIPTDTWLTNHLHLSNSLCRPLWSLAFKLFWSEVEEVVTSTGKVYAYLTSDPKYGSENKALLDTAEGREHLTKMCRYFYAFLRLYTFRFTCPICGKPIDAINEAWEKYPDSAYWHSECLEQVRQQQGPVAP